MTNENEICENCGHTKEEHYRHILNPNFVMGICGNNCYCKEFVPKNQSNNQHNTTEKGHYESDAPVSHKPSLKSDTEDTFGSADRKTELSESGSRIEDGSVSSEDEAILKEEMLRKDIEDKRMYRVFEISEDIWQRFLKGEVNLTENLFNEFRELLKRTNDIEIAKAKLEGFLAGQEAERKSKEEEFSTKYMNYQADCRDKEIADLKQQLSSQKEKILEIFNKWTFDLINDESRNVKPYVGFGKKGYTFQITTEDIEALKTKIEGENK